MTDAANQKILEALSKAQGEFPEIIKEKVNPHFKSKYADIAAVIATIKPVLAKHGLGFRQTIQGGEMVTTVFHASGETLESAVPLILPAGATMQHLGGAITYARRYGLQCAVGVAAEDDDDGNAASQERRISPPAQKFTVYARQKVVGEFPSLQGAVTKLAETLKAVTDGVERESVFAENNHLMRLLEAQGATQWRDKLYEIATGAKAAALSNGKPLPPPAPDLDVLEGDSIPF